MSQVGNCEVLWPPELVVGNHYRTLLAWVHQVDQQHCAVICGVLAGGRLWLSAVLLSGM